MVSNEKYKDWIKNANDKHKAYCTVCLNKFSVAGQGIKALDIHVEGKGHKDKCKQSEYQSKFASVNRSEETAEK